MLPPAVVVLIVETGVWCSSIWDVRHWWARLKVIGHLWSDQSFVLRGPWWSWLAGFWVYNDRHGMGNGEFWEFADYNRELNRASNSTSLYCIQNVFLRSIEQSCVQSNYIVFDLCKTPPGQREQGQGACSNSRGDSLSSIRKGIMACSLLVWRSGLGNFFTMGLLLAGYNAPLALLVADKIVILVLAIVRQAKNNCVLYPVVTSRF